MILLKERSTIRNCGNNVCRKKMKAKMIEARTSISRSYRSYLIVLSEAVRVLDLSPSFRIEAIQNSGRVRVLRQQARAGQSNL